MAGQSWGENAWGGSAGAGAADPWTKYGSGGNDAKPSGNDAWSAGGGAGGGAAGGGGAKWWESAGGAGGAAWSAPAAGADPWGGDGKEEEAAGGNSWGAAAADGDGAAGGWGGGGWADDSDPKSWADKLNLNIDWQGVQLVPIGKNNYSEHPDVRRKTPEEVIELRKKFDIEVLAGGEHDGGVPCPVMTFEEASFPDWLLSQVLKKGFRQPTPIQLQVWPVALQGRDLIGIAETGSGKTLAYVLPMMIHIIAQEELKANEGPVGVVLCPTRELALQIDNVTKDYIGLSGLKSTCVYGGVPVREQGYALQEKNDIVVATPGRFIQLLNDGWTNLNRVTYVCLDEADEMLSKGFGEQIRLILSQIRPDRQMLMFSATWPREVQELAKEHCTACNSEGMEPVMVRIGGDVLAACRTIQQNVLVLEWGVDKFDKLREAIIRSGCDKPGYQSKCLIFCRTKANVDELVSRLSSANIEVYGLHSDKPQNERIWVLDQFRNGELTCLAATQCLGRGHDIPRVKYVINYDAPDNIEAYIHRIGRTGRAGESGFAMTFLTDKDGKLAVPLVEVLQRTGQKASPKLQDLAAQFQAEAPWATDNTLGWDQWEPDAAAAAEVAEAPTQGWNGQQTQ